MTKMIRQYLIPYNEWGEKFEMKLPGSHEILSVQVQGGVAVMYALVRKDITECEVNYKFVVFKNGQGIHAEVTKLSYVGSWQIESASFHMFRAPR